jgi:hypothetical protein
MIGLARLQLIETAASRKTATIIGRTVPIIKQQHPFLISKAIII